MDRSDLRPIQLDMIEKIKDRDGIIMAWDMGAGKGVTALTAMTDLIAEGEVKKVLVVAPLLVAQATWPNEIEEWDHVNLDYTVLRVEDDDADVKDRRKVVFESFRKAIGMESREASNRANRFKTVAKKQKLIDLTYDESPVHIINRQALPWLWKQRQKGWPYDMLVFDEASMFKNGKKKTSLGWDSEFGAAVKARRKSKKAVLLTGTPSPKGLKNLWGLAYVADLGQRLGKSKNAFEDRFFTRSYYDLHPRPTAKEQITESLKDIMFTLNEKDYAKLPMFNSIKVEVKMPEDAIDRYENMVNYWVDQGAEAVNKAGAMNKCLQMANGFVYTDSGYDVIHSAKVDALERLVDRVGDEPLLVAYIYQADKASILERFPWAEVFADPRKTVDRWNKRQIRMLLCHPAQVGHGQNLQFGGNQCVWFGLTFDLELYQQFNKRLHRPGQDRPVFAHHIIATDTFDTELIDLLRSDAEEQADIMRRFERSVLARNFSR